MMTIKQTDIDANAIEILMCRDILTMFFTSNVADTLDVTKISVMLGLRMTCTASLALRLAVSGNPLVISGRSISER